MEEDEEQQEHEGRKRSELDDAHVDGFFRPDRLTQQS